MSEFMPVATLTDLNDLNTDEIVEGYRAGSHMLDEPGSDKSRSFWHGWRNAQMDYGRLMHDAAATRLVREYLGARVRGH